MKKNLLKSLMVIGMVLAIQIVGQAQVIDFESFKSTFETLKSTPGGGNMVLENSITINEPYTLESTTDNPVAINASTPNQIIVGTGGFLTIGEGVTISTTTAAFINVTAGGTLVTYDGCIITSTASRPVQGDGGMITINGGTITTSNHPAVQANSASTVVTINSGDIASTNTATLTRGLIVQNGSKAVINGGTISADPSVSGRGVGLIAGTLIVNGGTISAAGTSGRGIQGDDNGALIYINGGTIKAENANTTGNGAVVLQKGTRAIITGGTYVCQPNKALVVNAASATAKFWDFRAFSLSADPVAGTYDAEQTVTLIKTTAPSTICSETGAVLTNFAEGAAIHYTIDGTNPDQESAVYTTPFSVPIPTTVKTVAVKDGFLGLVNSFTYSSITTGLKQPNQKIANVNTVLHEVIDLSGINEVNNVEILNLNGQVVRSFKNPTANIQVSDLKQGVYILKINAREGSLTQKVIKR